MEIWKPIKGYENRYWVSNEGRVWRSSYVDTIGRTKKERILCTAVSRNGYEKVCLIKDGVKATKLVHRLVGEAFLENPENLPMINHKDENKRNNNAENLEWCDSTYNNNYGTSNYRQARTKGRKVAQFLPNGEFVCDYYSIMEASRRAKVSAGSICQSLTLGKPTNGFLWKDTKEVKVYA